MINKDYVTKFFDNLAETWDDDQVDRTKVINEILDVAGCNKNDVLDVACGSGLLFPYYVERDCNVVAVDISQNMVELAKKRCESKGYDKIEVVKIDVEDYNPCKQFDSIVVYNAYPHFPDGFKLVNHLYNILKPGGRLTIAHGFSRETINKHHSGLNSHVSRDLEDAQVLADIFLVNQFDVDNIISDDEKYIVSGFKQPSK